MTEADTDATTPLREDEPGGYDDDFDKPVPQGVDPAILECRNDREVELLRMICSMTPDRRREALAILQQAAMEQRARQGGAA